MWSRSLAPLVVTLTLALVLASGHMNSGDGGGQLRSALEVCQTGHAWSSTQLDRNWVRSGSRYWESHDIGAIILMLPGACAGEVLSHSSLPALAGPPKVFVSLTYSLLAGLGLWFMWRCLSLITSSASRGWWLTLLFAGTTTYVAYLKSAWDVLGACVAIAGLAWCVAELLVRRRTVDQLLPWMVAAGLVACAFRYSMLPFVVLFLAALAWRYRDGLRRRTVALSVGLGVLLVLPSLVYNDVRMGSLLRPATMAAQFKPDNEPTTHVLSGLEGMLVARTVGIAIYAPICLVAFALWVPRIRRSLTKPARFVADVAAVSCLAFVVSLSTLTNWGAFGWGPRYLLPLMPVAFAGAVVATQRMRSLLPVTALAAAVGAAVNLPLLITNWHAVRVVATASAVPKLWQSMWHGLTTGRGLGDNTEPRALAVPDVWWWHAVQSHGVPYGFALVVLAAAVGGIVWAGRKVASVSPFGLESPGPESGVSPVA